MRLYILAVLFFLIASYTFGQRQIRQVEINPFVRFDNYPQFFYVLGGRPNTDYVNIKGTSFGINLAYKIPIAKSIFFKPGIGYYGYSFNDIKRENTMFGKSSSRDINFTSPVFIPFYTDKYWYSSVSVNIGIEKSFYLNEGFQVNTGLNVTNYFTFSQYYHLTNNPQGSQDFNRKRNDYFGTSVYFNINPVKKIRRISLGPSLIIPVYDIWKTDATFQEETNAGTRDKWSKGIGIGISFNYLLTKK